MANTNQWEVTKYGQLIDKSDIVKEVLGVITTKIYKYQDKHYVELWDNGYCNHFSEALEIAVEALRKQKPMKSVIEQGAPSYYGGIGICRDYCGCPKCGEEVGRGDDKANYCPYCGQKIDWTED